MYEAGVRRCTKRVSTLNIYIKNSVAHEQRSRPFECPGRVGWKGALGRYEGAEALGALSQFIRKPRLSLLLSLPCDYSDR